MKPVPFEPLDPGVYRELVRRALAEDFGWGDVTTEATVDASLSLAAVAEAITVTAAAPAVAILKWWRRFVVQQQP